MNRYQKVYRALAEAGRPDIELGITPQGEMAARVRTAEGTRPPTEEEVDLIAKAREVAGLTTVRHEVVLCPAIVVEPTR